MLRQRWDVNPGIGVRARRTELGAETHKIFREKLNSYDLRINLFVIISQNGTNLLRDNLGDIMYGLCEIHE